MLTKLYEQIIKQYALNPNGIHGVEHWKRVKDHGLHLAKETGAKAHIVELFALLHDSHRLTEGTDNEHGKRAAEFAVKMNGIYFNISEEDLDILCVACKGHTTELTHHDVTVQTCWDADRLDLWRIEVTPDPKFLSTQAI
ncbi:MAG: hypothetical protein HQL29_05545 [Candidatus Omnitrophica bacterium]|nr:hypothetical protein [Candidatus Omnitrophota bacterium]